MNKFVNRSTKYKLNYILASHDCKGKFFAGNAILGGFHYNATGSQIYYNYRSKSKFCKKMEKF